MSNFLDLVSWEIVPKIHERMRKRKAVKFVEWCAKNYCPSVEQGVVTWTKEYYQNKDKVYTTSELYEIFNKEN